MQVIEEVKRVFHGRPTATQTENFWSANFYDPTDVTQNVLRAYAYNECLDVNLNRYDFILHIGCGRGELLADLSPKFTNLIGVEGNRRNVRDTSEKFDKASKPIIYARSPIGYYSNVNFGIEEVFRPIADLTICVDILSRMHPEDFRPISQRIAEHTNHLIVIENERTFHKWKFRHNYMKAFKGKMHVVRRFPIRAPGMEPGRWVVTRFLAKEQKRLINAN